MIKLIKEYHSIENLYENIDKITQKKLKENLIKHKEDAFHSKVLSTIKCDVDIIFDVTKFNYTLEINEQMEQLFLELEFKKLLLRLNSEYSEKPQKLDVEFKIEPIENYVNELVKSDCPISISYMIEQNKGFFAFFTNNQIWYSELQFEDNVHQKCLKSIIENDSEKYIHDIKFLKHALISYNIEVKGKLFDTFIASYLLEPTDSTYEIADLNGKFLSSYQLKTNEELLGKGKSMKQWSQLEPEISRPQLAKRAEVIFNLVKEMTKILENQNMLDLFYEVEMPLIDVLFDMEIEGITIDPQALKDYGLTLDKLIKAVEAQVFEEVGAIFNINSPKQLGHVLFEKMGIPPIKKTKTGYSTSAEVLDTLKHNYPVVEKILEYRQYTKLKSTFVDGILNVMSENNKIHSTFKQTITATGRLSSTEPNLQNIPIRLELGRQIRKVFIPKNEDFVFLDADYSQIELRVLAALSKDPTMMRAFTENIDIHTLTASQVFQINIDEVNSIQRHQAKAVNFGIVYGIGAFSLAEDIKVSLKEAQWYIDNYFDKYPKVKLYLDNLVNEATKNGYATTILNRRRNIPELTNKNFNLKEFGKRVAMNMPIQGSSADIIKIAMIKVHKELKDRNLQSKLILTVHDELLLDVYKPELEEVKVLLKTQMENAIDLGVPLVVETNEGDTWFDTK